MNETLAKAKRILQSLDDALAVGPWNETKFIAMIGKKVHLLRDDLAKSIHDYEAGETGSSEYLAHRAHLTANSQLVYISLYSLEGANLQAWERIIANLQRQIVSRPIYTEEADAINIIKTKDKKINEAYLSIYVDASAILELPDDKVPKDKLGKPMIVLKDNAVNLENIECFYHISGKYRFSRGKLTSLE